MRLQEMMERLKCLYPLKKSGFRAGGLAQDSGGFDWPESYARHSAQETLNKRLHFPLNLWQMGL